MTAKRQEWRTSLSVEDAVKCLPSDAFDLWIAGKLDIVSTQAPPTEVRATITHDYPEGAA